MIDIENLEAFGAGQGEKLPDFRVHLAIASSKVWVRMAFAANHLPVKIGKGKWGIGHAIGRTNPLRRSIKPLLAGFVGDGENARER